MKIQKPDDFHCHFRQEDLLRAVLSFTAKHFARAIVMPNKIPPVLTADDAEKYRRQILFEANQCGLVFEPLMTIQITDKTTPAMIMAAKRAGVVAGKVYPQGVTTNSHNGVTSFRKIHPVLREMQRQNMVLSLHGESPRPGVFCLDREVEFIPTLFAIARKFPKLKIVFEHISTEEAVRAVELLPSVGATITAHHFLLTLDDVVGGLIAPHNFCKPIAKRNEDREALLEAARSGNPKFFFGSDSAPHPKRKKECDHGCAGIFSAPVALAVMVQTFERIGALKRLEPFVSHFGADFYGLPRNEERITLVKEDWVVPQEYGGIVPFMADQTLHWKVAD